MTVFLLEQIQQIWRVDIEILTETLQRPTMMMMMMMMMVMMMMMIMIMIQMPFSGSTSKDVFSRFA